MSIWISVKLTRFLKRYAEQNSNVEIYKQWTISRVFAFEQRTPCGAYETVYRVLKYVRV